MNSHICNLFLRVGLVAAVVTSMVTSSWGQTFRQYKDFDRYRYLPRLPEGNENPPTLPDRIPEVHGDPTIIIKELKGIVLVDDPAQVVQGKLELDGVHVRGGDGLLNSRALERIVEAYLGEAVSMQMLDMLVRDIVIFYRQYDQPVVDVSVPEQDITDGVVQVIVTDAHVENVIVEGGCYFDPCVLVDQVCISPGDTIYESVLLEDLRWLYRNPFREVELELRAGSYRGATDVIFHVYDTKPCRVYGGYEDTGSQATGLERTFYGVNWYNALGRDDHAGYQYTASSDFSQLGAHSAFYSTALPNRDIITVYGTYADFKAPLGLTLTEGRTWQLLTRWYRECCPICCYEHAITAGFDFKQSNTNLEFGGFQVFGNKFDIAQFMIGYKGGMTDGFGSWHIGADTYYSPGTLSGHNKFVNFQAVRPGASPHYFYSRGFFDRRVNLPCCFEFVARFTGQVADGNLMPTEQLGLGGYNSIRGYDLFATVGDAGYFANLEFWTPAISTVIGCDELRFVSYYDFGDAYIHHTIPGQDGSIDMQSVGTGLRYKLPPCIELRADYGWQLARIPTQPHRQRWHIGAVMSY